MVSVLKRTAVLSFSRFANQAVMLLSPMLLVRLLSVGDYGGYREFMLYAGLIVPLVGFSVARSLPYLVPKYPQRERVWVTQAALFNLLGSCVAISLIYIGGDQIRANTSFDFVLALQLYILFFANLDFLEFYWLGKKRTDYILYYSAGRLLMRTVLIVSVAALTRDALAIVYGIIAVEVTRCALVLWFTICSRWYSLQISRDSIALQTSYFLPLGFGGVIETLNANIGMLFISTVLGAKALAFYAIGTFATKIVDILRGAIADVIFPDMVEVKSASAKDALPLWQRATVWYCVMLFPAAIIFSYYSDAIVTILFTRDYAEAIPVFSAISLMMYLYCFDFHLPLRVQNANRYFVVGSVIALLVNVVMLYPMYLLFGLVGPVIAFIVSRLLMTIYLAHHVRRLYAVSFKELVLWTDMGKVFAASVVCLPILMVGKYATDHLLLRAMLFSIAYMAAYLSLLRWLGVWDATAIISRFRLARKRQSGSA